MKFLHPQHTLLKITGPHTYSIDEAERIERFTKSIDTVLGTARHFDSFFSGLKPGEYATSSIYNYVKWSKKQSKRWQKGRPYRIYLDSINDTLNKYLADTLTTYINTYNPAIEEDDYLVTFSKNNRVKSVKVVDPDFLDMEERVLYRRSCKLIRRAFRRITIHFVHSKIAYRRQVSFWNGKVEVHKPR